MVYGFQFSPRGAFTFLESFDDVFADGRRVLVPLDQWFRDAFFVYIKGVSEAHEGTLRNPRNFSLAPRLMTMQAPTHHVHESCRALFCPLNQWKAGPQIVSCF